MSMRIAAALVCLSALCACGEVIERDSARACAFEQQATLPATVEGGVPVVDASINGKPLHLIVDTGSTSTTVFEHAAETLGARTDWSRLSVMTGLNGVAVRHNLAIDDFRLGAQAVDQKAVSVGVSSPHMPGFADGLLGMDVLSRFDVDFDLPNKRIVLYRWRNCPGGSALGDTSWFAVPLADETRKTGRPFVTGTLDGGAVLVMIDSGASALNVRHDAALRVGVPAATLEGERQVDVNGVGPDAVRGAIHRFRLFSIGDLRMRNIPGLVSTPGPTDADVLFGAPMLRVTRVWLSTAGGRLYLARRPQAANATVTPTPGK